MKTKAQLLLENAEAFDRGQRDCANYYEEKGRGAPEKNNYPSNPYPKDTDEYYAYNCGWNTKF